MNRESAISWFASRVGRVSYSMVDRNGPHSYDCSSAIYLALIQAGNFPDTIRIGNTDSLFGDLERHGWIKVAENADGSIDTQRGDIFLWGKRGQSSGSFGHTGFFIDADNIIHCSFGYNGIAVSNHDWLWNLNGQPELTVYRFTGYYSASEVVSNAVSVDPTDQIVEVGSWIKFERVYVANDVQEIDGIWQIRTNELCQSDFTWAENGIPAALVTEVDNEGYSSKDQELDVGSLYKIPGSFKVMDVGQYNGRWLAQVGYGVMSFWVDLETCTEIQEGDSGTAVPSERQTNVEVVVTPPPAEPLPIKTDPEPPVNPEPQPLPIKTDPAPQEGDGDIAVGPMPAENSNEPKENKMSNFVISQIRTYVPIAVGAILSVLATIGLQLDADTSAGLIVFLTGFLQAAYYLVARLLEKKFPQLGFLLGTSTQPTYKK